MKRVYFLLMAGLLFLPATNCDAQLLKSLGERAVDRAKTSVRNRMENEVDRQVDNKLDNAENSLRSGFKKKEHSNASNETQSNEAQQNNETTSATSGWTCEECGKVGNTGGFCSDCGAKKGGAAQATAAPAKKVSTAYSKSDFVPGDEVFYEDTFEKEQMGEFPSKWDLIEGSGEVAKIDERMCINFDNGCKIEPLMKDQKSYLPDMFTIEFDYFRAEDEYSMEYSILLLNQEDEVVSLRLSNSDLNLGYKTPSGDSRGANYELKEGQQHCNAWNHLAISFNKRALKIYVNGERIFNIPSVAVTTRLRLSHGQWGGFNDSKMNAITNFKMCKGAVPLYDRLASDGKIITYAITFEHGKADLKPESMVEIMRIAKLMNDQPGVSFEVQGHCDATGSDKVNDPLSQKRAEAIVAALVEQGIASSRLTAVGKGSHSPLADNSTEEGRAKNRRVEFVKK